MSDGPKRPGGPRGGRPGGSGGFRGGRPSGPRGGSGGRPFGPRAGGDRSFGPRPGGDRPRFPADRPRFPTDRPRFPDERPRFPTERPGGDRPPYPGDRSARQDDRPREFRPRPPADRASQDRLGQDRPRPAFDGPRRRFDGPRPPSDRPRQDRQGSGRPSRPFDPRPSGPRPFGPRAPRFGDGEPSRTPEYRAAPAPELEEGEELIAGRRPVEEAFTAGRPPRRLLVTPQRRQALEKIVLHATTLRIPIVEVEGGSLTALAGFDGHQGVAVVVEARRFASVEDILARAIERREPPFVLVLDSLEDPQNVGTLLRSAEAAGVHGVVFPTERQAPLSPAAIKASAGATEHLLLAPVDDLAGALTDLHLRGLRIVGSEADAPMTAREADLRGATAIVVGSEGHGLSPAIRRRCDLFVRIPMRGVIGSLNASVAGSILLFEALGQRDPGARPDGFGPVETAGVAEAAVAETAPELEPPAKPKRASRAKPKA